MNKTGSNVLISDKHRCQFIKFSEFSNTIVIFLSLDLKIIDFNLNAEKIYQWDRNKVLNTPYFDWCKENTVSAPFCLTKLDSIINGATLESVENIINNGENIIQWQVASFSDENNTPNGIILIGEEVTFLRHYNQQLEKLAHASKSMTGHDIGPTGSAYDYISNVYTYLERIISSMPCYVYWKDKNFVYLGCNDLSLELVNLSSRKEIIGKTDYDFGWDKEKVDEFRRIDMEIVKTGKPVLNHEEAVKKENGELFLLVNKMPIFDGKNNVIGIVGISIDITERKRAERELIKAKEIAETTDRLKSEFIHNMEHDIRTPFTGILGMTKILEDLETDPNKKQIILDILLCTQELLDYSCGILDFSRIESGVFPVMSQEFSIYELIKSVELLEMPTAKMKDLDFSISYENDIPDFIIGDEYRLKRILINLLSNSTKFTSKGFIKLFIKINTVKDDNIMLSFIVEDSGIGIEKKKLDNLYTKFGRLMPSNEGVYKGYGLGLRIVKQFVNEMEGEVDIKSEFGKGTVVTCSFPFKLPLMEKSKVSK
jgi:PAS domain S-box-containing protein